MGMLQVEPAEELVLEGPFNRAVCKKIKVYNPSKHSRVAFKLKTTTPRLFFVRPNVGLVQPGERVSIDIFVHPVYRDYNAQRHKFLMQAAEANDKVENLQEFWKTVNPAFIWDTKIKVKFAEDAKPIVEPAKPPSAAGEHAKQEENTNSMDDIMQRVSMLELERESLLQKVEELTKENEQQKLQVVKGGRSLFRSALPLFLIIGIVCVILGYQGYL